MTEVNKNVEYSVYVVQPHRAASIADMQAEIIHNVVFCPPAFQ